MATLADAELFLSAVNKMHGTTHSQSVSEHVDSSCFIHRDQFWPPPSSPTSVSTRSPSPTTSTLSASSSSSTSSSHSMATRSRAKAEARRPVKMQNTPTVKRGEQERINTLQRDALVAEIGPHEVWCLGCDAFVVLDSSRMYSVYHWLQHKELYHVPGGKMYEREQFLKQQRGTHVKLFNSRRRPRSRKHIEIARKLKRTQRH